MASELGKLSGTAADTADFDGHILQLAKQAPHYIPNYSCGVTTLVYVRILYLLDETSRQPKI